ncbi:MAG: peptidase S9, partial [Marinilabiliales bacterium]|nr:peptidase S9 [Marinilabiliales bacterium]
MKKTLFAFVLVAMFLPGFAESLPAGQPQKKNYVPETPKLTSDLMTPEVLWSFGRVGAFQVSPDGRSVLYDVTYFNISENKSYRDLYLVPVSGGAAVRLTDTPEKESEAAWRPDGKKIGYISTRTGEPQLWEINPDGTNPVQVSKVKDGIAGFGYSPDLKHIFYIANVKLDQDVHDKYPDLPLANARLYDDLMYRHWDTWSDGTYQHVFVAKYSEMGLSEDVDIQKGERYDTPLKPNGGSEQIAWSPDGKVIAYTCKKKAGKDYALSTNSDIYLYTLEQGKTTNLTEGMMGYDMNPVFSPDGKRVAWESMERDGYEADKIRLYVADLSTGTKKDYSRDFDQNAQNLTWSADGKSIWFVSDIKATDEIFTLDLTSGKFRRVTDGIHNYQSFGLAGNQIVASKVSMSQPAELYLVDPATGKDKPLTTVCKGIMDQLAIGKVESRWITTTDHKKMRAWVIYPPHFDPSKKYPALLFCEGGPQSTVSQFWSYRWNFQMMAAKGYIIIAPNRRGL